MLDPYPLHNAVQRSDIEAVARLIAEGVDLNALDDLRMSPLAWAVYGGYAEIAELLCQAGADVDLRFGTGETALWHAEDDFGLWEISSILRRYRATVK